MPHCGHCLRFYPQAMPAGCPFCDAQKYHKAPFCQFCHKLHVGVAEVGPGGEPLRPSCPECGRGPMLPSHKELHRRLSMDIKILPFIPTKEEIKAALDCAGQPVEVDGAILALVSVRRTQGPLELVVKSAPIEEYFERMSAIFNGGEARIDTHENNQQLSAAAKAAGIKMQGNPFSGIKYYYVPIPQEQFYDIAGRRAYSMRGFGTITMPPGMPGDRGNDMSFLLARGLKDGAMFTFPVVITDHGAIEVLQAVKDGIVAFYTAYMKPTTHNVIIAVRHEAPKVKADAPAVAERVKELINFDEINAVTQDEVRRQQPMWITPPQPVGAEPVRIQTVDPGVETIMQALRDEARRVGQQAQPGGLQGLDPEGPQTNAAPANNWRGLNPTPRPPRNRR